MHSCTYICDNGEKAKLRCHEVEDVKRAFEVVLTQQYSDMDSVDSLN